MSYPATVLTVMIASPSDLPEDRDAVRASHLQLERRERRKGRSAGFTAPRADAAPGHALLSRGRRQARQAARLDANAAHAGFRASAMIGA